MQRIPPELTTSARRFRSEATEVERHLWHRLRGRRPRFIRQCVIGHYIIDFACRSAKLAIELDGGQHARNEAMDAKRTAYLDHSAGLYSGFGTSISSTIWMAWSG